MNADMRDTTGIMTECKDIKNQEECDNYTKASHNNHCLHLRFEQFCTFLEQTTNKTFS